MAKPSCSPFGWLTTSRTMSVAPQASKKRISASRSVTLPAIFHRSFSTPPLPSLHGWLAGCLARHRELPGERAPQQRDVRAHHDLVEAELDEPAGVRAVADVDRRV